MAAPHYIIHIGPHKTGTSHLQTCLKANAARLEAAGIHLATQWEASPENPSHTKLVARLTSEGRGDVEPAFDAWRRSGYRKVVISAEDLVGHGLGPCKVGILGELTAGAMVTIVSYVRRWTELLASTWQEYVKQGSAVTLPEALVHNLRDASASPIINVEACLGAYLDVFGPPALRLVCYDSVLASGLDIFQHFADQFLDGLPVAIPAGPRSNASFSSARVELMRMFNRMSQQTGLACHMLRRFVALDHVPAPMAAILKHLERHETYIEVNDADLAAQEVLFRCQARLGMCVVDPAPADRLYVPKAARLAYIDPIAAITPGLADAIWRLWSDLHAMAPAHR
jgi:hypothetical protein